MTKVLGFVSPLILLIFEKIAEKADSGIEKEEKEEEKKEEKKEKRRYMYISVGLTAVCWIYSFVSILCPDGVIFSALLWIQANWWIAGIYILTAAILPSAVAKKEHTKRDFRANENYVGKNFKFNISGAAASCAVFGLVYLVVGDFNYLKFFYIEDLIPIIATVSVWIAVIYQKIERKKDKAGEVDHDTSLKYMNQKLNLLHLFNVFFLAIVSVVYLVSYTIYCRTYHIRFAIHPCAYYVLITVALIFFYLLSLHKHRYLYLTFIIFVPVILISSVYWMTWFTLNEKMRFWQWAFVFIHSMIYIFLVFKKERVIYTERNEAGKRKIMSDNYFLLAIPVVVSLIFIIVYALPSFIDRLPANEAYNYIDMICADTDVDVDAMIEKAMEQEMYNEIDENYDIQAFMKFLATELGVQLMEKEVIKEVGDIPTREVLENKYINTPRYGQN